MLKGPQGALYGRNAIGGAIIITTKQPTDQLEGNVTAGIDNGFGFYTHGGLSGPLSDNVKFRIAGLYKDTDGYIPNPYLGRECRSLQGLRPAREPAVRHRRRLEPRPARLARPHAHDRASGTTSSPT